MYLISVAKLMWFRERVDEHKQCYTMEEMMELIDRSGLLCVSLSTHTMYVASWVQNIHYSIFMKTLQIRPFCVNLKC